MTDRIIYIAYGSNLNLTQMAQRCPEARLLGSAAIPDYKLEFRGPQGDVYATVTPMKGGSVPVLLWDIGPEDEAALDIYEDYPNCYRKESLSLTVQGRGVEGMIYIMNNNPPFGQPSKKYFNTILEGYNSAGFPQDGLFKALEEAQQRSQSQVAPPEKHHAKVGIELRILNNLTMRHMEKHSHKKDVDAITGTNGWIIGFLAHNSHRDIFQRDLEQQFGITRSTASKVVSLMIQKGLLAHESVPYDARLKKLVLTEKSINISHIMDEDGRKFEAQLTKGFSPEELETLLSYIQRMKDNIKE